MRVASTTRIAKASRQGRLWLSITLTVVWLAWLAAIYFSARLVTTNAFDFFSYYAAALALRFAPHTDIYSVTTLLQSGQAHGQCALSGHRLPAYLYPPLLAILLEPLTLLSCANATVIWLLFNAALWVVSTALLADLLARRWGGRRLAAVTVISVMSLGFWQAFYGMFLGQVHLVMLLGVTLALWLADRGRLRLAGGALAFVAALKLLPALMVVYYLARGRWRVVVAAALVGAALLAVMLAVTGETTLIRSGLVIFGLVGAAGQPNLNEALFVAPIVGKLLVAAAGLAWLVVVARRGGDDLLGVGWTLCTMLLLAPLVWSFYLVWLLPAYCACFAAIGPLSCADWRGRAAWAALTIIYLVMAYPLSQELRPFATLALWALTGALYWRSSVGARWPTLSATAQAERVDTVDTLT